MLDIVVRISTERIEDILEFILVGADFFRKSFRRQILYFYAQIKMKVHIKYEKNSQT
jgi:hypothetical protein